MEASLLAACEGSLAPKALHVERIPLTPEERQALTLPEEVLKVGSQRSPVWYVLTGAGMAGLLVAGIMGAVMALGGL